MTPCSSWLVPKAIIVNIIMIIIITNISSRITSSDSISFSDYWFDSNAKTTAARFSCFYSKPSCPHHYHFYNNVCILLLLCITFVIPSYHKSEIIKTLFFSLSAAVVLIIVIVFLLHDLLCCIASSQRDHCNIKKDYHHPCNFLCISTSHQTTAAKYTRCIFLLTATCRLPQTVTKWIWLEVMIWLWLLWEKKATRG